MSHRTKARLAATAAALVGGLALALPPTASADPTDTGNPADVNTLAGTLSKGYNLNNCAAQTITSGQLASLACGQSADPNGPAQARYQLFGNANDLTAAFNAAIKDEAQTNCGETKSPTHWHQGNNPNGGQVACGTYQDGAEIVWTTEGQNVLSAIRGPNADVAALYQWWLTNG